MELDGEVVDPRLAAAIGVLASPRGNVPMLTIKELAGHQSLETTMRYMHLAPAAPRAGMRALEGEGTLGATPSAAMMKASGDG